MASPLRTRLSALKAKLEPDTIEILNPRYGIDGEGAGLTREEHEAACQERIRAAEKAGHHIIRIQPLRDFAE